jgi:hypothetical protein
MVLLRVIQRREVVWQEKVEYVVVFNPFDTELFLLPHGELLRHTTLSREVV